MSVATITGAKTGRHEGLQADAPADRLDERGANRWLHFASDRWTMRSAKLGAAGDERLCPLRHRRLSRAQVDVRTLVISHLGLLHFVQDVSW